MATENFQCAKHSLVALSTRCSKFPEKFLYFWKVANLNFNHTHINLMINYSINFGPYERFFQK